MTPENPTAYMAVHHFCEADPELRSAGLGWYATAERDVRRLAELLPVGIGQSSAAGILAALSPQTQWTQNWLWAERICRAAGANHSRRPRIGGFPANRAKAWRIANGESPGDVLGGPKVRAFWRALAGDPDATVLDLWIFRAFGLPEAPSHGVYQRTAHGLREAANRLSVPARDLQAVIWLHVRGVRPGDPASYFPTAPTATVQEAA